ncbi:MAG: HD domain-containing protein [Oscillospiraceae bacterium]|nr:HD domain-containing protein [Oscillospiraceae bacterium]
MSGYPNQVEALRLLREAEKLNPGAWADHSRVAARCARKIAAAAGMNADKAYVLGLLHDVGRRFGRGHLMHVYHGYYYMKGLGYEDAARICLTHSFPVQDFEIFIGRRDIPESQQDEIRTLIDQMIYDDYDRLIQLCDGLGGTEGVADIQQRMLDVKTRYGSYPQEQWDRVMELKAYFEEKTGKDIYEIVK